MYLHDISVAQYTKWVQQQANYIITSNYTYSGRRKYAYLFSYMREIFNDNEGNH